MEFEDEVLVENVELRRGNIEKLINDLDAHYKVSAENPTEILAALDVEYKHFGYWTWHHDNQVNLKGA